MLAPLVTLAALAPFLAPSQLLLLAALHGAALIGLRLRHSAQLQDTWQRLCARSSARLVDLDAQLCVDGDLRGARAAQLLVTDTGLFIATMSRAPLGALYRDVRAIHADAAPWVPDALRCVLVEPPAWDEDTLLLRVLDATGRSSALLRVDASDPRALRRRLPPRLSR